MILTFKCAQFVLAHIYLDYVFSWSSHCSRYFSCWIQFVLVFCTKRIIVFFLLAASFFRPYSFACWPFALSFLLICCVNNITFETIIIIFYISWLGLVVRASMCVVSVVGAIVVAVFVSFHIYLFYFIFSFCFLWFFSCVFFFSCCYFFCLFVYTRNSWIGRCVWCVCALLSSFLRMW